MARCKTARHRCETHGADALLVTNPVDIRYLSGFVGEDSWALVPTRGRAVWLLSDFRFEEQIAREAPQAKAIMRKASLVGELAKLTEKLGVDRVAIQPSYVTVTQRKAMVKALGYFGIP